MTLIERVLAGPGSRELSDEVLIACGWTRREEPLTVLDGVPQAVAIIWADTDGRRVFEAPSPTESIDDSLLIVPKRCDWHIEPDGAWLRWITKTSTVQETQCVLTGRDGKCTALALTAAALRARMEG